MEKKAHTEKMARMGCSGSYYYNPHTDRLLLTLEGQEDEFTRWFNGEITEEELPDTYNGYDRMVRADIRGMLGPDAFRMVSGDGSLLRGEHGGYFKVTVLAAAPERMEYLLGDDWRTEVIRGISYSQEQKSAMNRGPFKQKQHRDYDPEQNCLTLAAGDQFALGGGIRMVVREDDVEWVGDCAGGESEMPGLMAEGLKSLIYFADQRGCAGSIPSACYPRMIELLTRCGVDTSKEFGLNETRCHIVGGKIREVGNVDGMPLSIYHKTRQQNHIRLEEPLCRRQTLSAEAAACHTKLCRSGA